MIGEVNYAKELGLSVHMAASYVIAKRGLQVMANSKTSLENLLEAVKYKEDKSLIKEIKEKKICIHYQGQEHTPTVIVDRLLEKSLVGNWQCIDRACREYKKALYKLRLHDKLRPEQVVVEQSEDPFNVELISNIKGDRIKNFPSHIPDAQYP